MGQAEFLGGMSEEEGGDNKGQKSMEEFKIYGIF